MKLRGPRRAPQRREDTRRPPAEPALDGVRKLLTAPLAAVRRVVDKAGSSFGAAGTAGAVSGHLVASAGLPVVSVRQGRNIRPRRSAVALGSMLGRVLRSWRFGATPLVSTR